MKGFDACQKIGISVHKSFMDDPFSVGGGGTGGARGARAPPISGTERAKICLDSCLFSWPISVVHPLILAPCAALASSILI